MEIGVGTLHKLWQGDTVSFVRGLGLIQAFWNLDQTPTEEYRLKQWKFWLPQTTEHTA